MAVARRGGNNAYPARLARRHERNLDAALSRDANPGVEDPAMKAKPSPAEDAVPLSTPIETHEDARFMSTPSGLREKKRATKLAMQAAAEGKSIEEAELSPEGREALELRGADPDATLEQAKEIAKEVEPQIRESIKETEKVDKQRVGETETDHEPEDLSEMAVGELRQVASELEIPGRSGMNKGDLIRAIRKEERKRARANR